MQKRSMKNGVFTVLGLAIIAGSVLCAPVQLLAQAPPVRTPPAHAPKTGAPQDANSKGDSTRPAFDQIEIPRQYVLTGNPGAGEQELDTGATYTANPAFNDPRDPENHRLMDGDGILDWTTTTGLNTSPTQTVLYDLQGRLSISEVALRFDMPNKPDSIAVAIADKAEGPWRETGVLLATEQKDPKEQWWRLPIDSALGRFVRLNFTSKGSWYLREVKLYGIAPTKAAKPVLRRGNELILADKTGPHAQIVLGDRPHTTAIEAASLFQSLTRRLIGISLPIVPESKRDPKTTAILIGDSNLARKNGVSVAQVANATDHYIMRTGKTWVALVGNDARCVANPGDTGYRWHRGSVYAVYDFFERHGYGWYGTEDLWQVVPTATYLGTPPLAVEETAAFAMRHLWMAMGNHTVSDAWRLGGLYLQNAHNYDNLVSPAKYKAEHPDWFGPNQPDITNPEVIAVAAATLSAEMDARPDDPICTFSATSNDAEGFKTPPFKPEVGNYAAQELYFANEIAKKLRVLQPKRPFLLTILGYWPSHGGPAPMLKAEPEVKVMVVNEGNHAKPLEYPEPNPRPGRNNARELAAIKTWKETGGLASVYEWWIPVLSYAGWKETPWYDGDTAVANQRFWYKNGIRYLTYESQAETNSGFPLRWAQYYVGSRGMWNPNIDPHQVLLEACRKLYGPAAETMTSFYEVQQAAMRATLEPGYNWALPLPHLIYVPEVEAKGDGLLDKADELLKGLPTDDRMRWRVAIERAQWQRMKELNAAAREKK